MNPVGSPPPPPSDPQAQPPSECPHCVDRHHLVARIDELEGQLRSLLESPAWAHGFTAYYVRQRLARSGLIGRLLAGGLALGAACVSRPLAPFARFSKRARLDGFLFPFKPPDLPASFQDLSFPAPTPTGHASIVIPAFNQAAFTYTCLQAVLRFTRPGSYEVIVVDNGSTDRTAELLDRTSGARVIRNAANLGFAGACNQGAGAATGDFLVFLNNDTVVLAGWLDALLSIALAQDRAGAVGAKILSPDGRLQEAGSIVWSDGSGWNYGHADDPRRPEYGYVREVDYCSAACLLVRRSLFDRLGGFDPRYAPAYYEDVDLAFRIQSLGYSVLYQPHARVVHFKEITSSALRGTSPQRLDRANRTKLLEAHPARLAAQHAPNPAGVFRARDRRPGLRILIVDHRVPEPDRDAGSLRMTELLRMLVDLGHAPTFVAARGDAVQPHTDALQQLGIEVICGLASIDQYIQDHLAHLDLIVICRGLLALRHLPRLVAQRDRPTIVFDTVDLHHLRAERLAALEPTREHFADAAAMKATELRLARSSDRVWVTSAYEAELLRHEGLSIPIDIVPTIHRAHTSPSPFRERRDLVFVGNFEHPPNEDAALHFATDVFPAVRAALPGVRFLIVGPRPTRAVKALASDAVRVLGHVPDLDALLDTTRVSVAPLRYGAGLKGKIGQALARGVPVVTTSVGAEGLGLRHREHALIADDPAAFASAVVELYQDARLWEKLAAGGRSCVDRQFGYTVVRARLQEILATIATTRASRNP
jgi:GT2 family glycosyltransferase